MTLHDHRGRFERSLKPFVEWCAVRGVTPNFLTGIAFVAASVAGLAFYVSSPARWWLVLAGAGLLGLGAILDAADGLLARRIDEASALGDFLDHSMDRFADVAILLGLTFSPWVPVEVGLFAIVGTLLTSYMGTQAQAVGVGRDYGGLVGRADRLFTFFFAAIGQAVLVVAGLTPLSRLASGVTATVLDALGGTLLGLAVAWIALAGNVTAIQRFWVAYQGLNEAA